MTAPDPDQLSPEEEDETRRALRLLFSVVVVALATWFALSLVVTEHATLTLYGRSERSEELLARGSRRMYDASYQAWHLDRDAVWGEKPVVWVMGSSITREAVDAAQLRKELVARGTDVGVEKVAFDSGAPLFAWAMIDRMDIRPGDKVLLSVHYDNFRRDWLDHHDNLHTYMNHLMRPRHLWSIETMKWADKVDYSLASVPPDGFMRAVPQFREGIERWQRWLLRRQRYEEDGMPQIETSKPFTEREYVANFRDLKRTKKLALSAEDMQLEPGQVNHDALFRWGEEVRAAGADAWVIFLPPSPEYYERFEKGAFSERFHRHMREKVGPWYVRLSPFQQDHYTDYKHVNFRGRPLLTRQLAHLIAARPAGSPPVRRR
jgi:hypothetical protein